MKKQIALFLTAIAVLLIWGCGDEPKAHRVVLNPSDGCPTNNYGHEQEIIDFVWYRAFEMEVCEPSIRLVELDDPKFVQTWSRDGLMFYCLADAWLNGTSTYSVCTDGLCHLGGEIQILHRNEWSLCWILPHELYHAKLYAETGDGDYYHVDVGWKTIVAQMQEESCLRFK